jgi:hypothetical protein
MTTDKTEKEFNDMYLDSQDYESRFIFTPNIEEDADYKHLDKNLSITNLSSRYKEPEKAESILKALHTLSNPRYFIEVEEIIHTGFREEESVHEDLSTGEKVFVTQKFPVYEKIIVKKNRYPKTYHKLKSAFYALTTTSSARDGHLIKRARTRALERKDTIHDKTEQKNSFGFFKKAKKEYEE